MFPEAAQRASDLELLEPLQAVLDCGPEQVVHDRHPVELHAAARPLLIARHLALHPCSARELQLLTICVWSSATVLRAVHHAPRVGEQIASRCCSEGNRWRC